VKQKSGYKPEVKIREGIPKVEQQKGKPVKVLCPFCEIPHPIELGKVAACGTILQVKAVQTVYPVRTVHKHKLICIKCKQSGGEMVKFNQGYMHTHECTPNTKIMANPPEFSRLARAVYFMSPQLRKVIEKKYGLVKQVQEIDEHGKETGKVLGYFFFRGAT
jgi:hypothetical protein